MNDGGPAVGSPRDGETGPPLCVDLDGTLVHGDTLVEALLLLARSRPLLLARLPFWLARGKARLKERVAAAVHVDAAALPYNRQLLEHLRRERADGRRLHHEPYRDTGPAAAQGL